MNSIVRNLFILFVAISCQRDVTDIHIPSHIIPKDSMVSALTDMHIIEGAKVGQKIIGDERNAHSYYAKLYAKYHVSKEEFEESFNFYSQNPAVMDEIYTKVVERLNKIQQAPPRTPLIESDSVFETELPTQTQNPRPLNKKLREKVDSVNEN